MRRGLNDIAFSITSLFDYEYEVQIVLPLSWTSELSADVCQGRTCHLPQASSNVGLSLGFLLCISLFRYKKGLFSMQKTSSLIADRVLKGDVDESTITKQKAPPSS